MAGKTAVNQKYIGRRYREGAPYWLFRFLAVDCQGGPHLKVFSDNVCGSEDRALKAAITYRDHYLESIGELRRLGEIDHPRHRHKANISGIVGVRLSVQHKKYGSYSAWQAYGIIKGKQWKNHFSINIHGEMKAFKQACKLRFDRSGELAISVPISQLPCSPGVPWKRYRA